MTSQLDNILDGARVETKRTLTKRTFNQAQLLTGCWTLQMLWQTLGRSPSSQAGASPSVLHNAVLYSGT